MNNAYQEMQPVDIWYCEAGDSHVYVGVVNTGNGNPSLVATIKRTSSDAMDELSKLGKVVCMMPLSNMISSFLVDDVPLDKGVQ